MFRNIRQVAIVGAVTALMMGCSRGKQSGADTPEPEPEPIGPTPISIGPWIAVPDPSFPRDPSGIPVPKSSERVYVNVEMPQGLSNDMRVLSGYSDAIAVGTVTGINATTERDGVLWTTFSVDILTTLKGVVTSPATVNIIGGYDTHGVLYIPLSGSPTLVGQSYILFLRHAAPGEAFQWESVPVTSGRRIIGVPDAQAIKDGREDAVHDIGVLKMFIEQQRPLR